MNAVPSRLLALGHYCFGCEATAAATQDDLATRASTSGWADYALRGFVDFAEARWLVRRCFNEPQPFGPNILPDLKSLVDAVAYTRRAWADELSHGGSIDGRSSDEFDTEVIGLDFAELALREAADDHVRWGLALDHSC